MTLGSRFAALRLYEVLINQSAPEQQTLICQLPSANNQRQELNLPAVLYTQRSDDLRRDRICSLKDQLSVTFMFPSQHVLQGTSAVANLPKAQHQPHQLLLNCSSLSLRLSPCCILHFCFSSLSVQWNLPMPKATESQQSSQRAMQTMYKLYFNSPQI